jgi:hypothetical protein
MLMAFHLVRNVAVLEGAPTPLQGGQVVVCHYEDLCHVFRVLIVQTAGLEFQLLDASAALIITVAALCLSRGAVVDAVQ